MTLFWKEVVMDYLKVITCNSSGNTQENHKKKEILPG
jgi:hypothetical protein